MALIVLEGPDGGGKSTVARELEQAWLAMRPHYRAMVVHTGPPDPYDRCVYEEYELGLDAKREEILSDHTLIILDRWHVGDTVYARYRPDKKPRLSAEGMDHVEMALSSLGALKVMMLPPFHIVNARVEGDGDDYISHDDLARIHSEYQAHQRKYPYQVKPGDGWLTPEWTLKPSTAAKGLILRLRALDKPALARDFSAVSAGTWTGSLHPQVILAGDELGPANQRFTRPFTPFSPVTCGDWLLRSVRDAGLATTCGIINTGHPGVDLLALAAITPDARWIALGAKAAERLDSHGITYSRIPHPQWARRFSHGYPEMYTSLLRTATIPGMEGLT